MRSAPAILCGLIAATLSICAPAAHAQQAESSFSVGYARLFPSDNHKLYHSNDGAFLDADFAWRIPVGRVAVLAGFGLSGSGYETDQPIGHLIGGFFDDDFDRLNSEVGFFEVEPRLAITLWSAAVPGLYLKPRIGAGLLVDSYSVDHATANSEFVFVDTRDHTGAAFEIKPAVQAGYSWGWGSAGVEAYYMPAWGDFGRLGSSIQEIGAGLFFELRF